MNLVDPLRQPQRFIQQSDALMREAVQHPAGTDPFALIDAHLEASFERVMAQMASGGPGEVPAANRSSEGPRLASASSGPMVFQASLLDVASPMLGATGPIAGGLPGPGEALLTYGAYPSPVVSGVPSTFQAPVVTAAVPPEGAAASGSVGAELEPLIGEMSAKYAVPDWLVRNVIRVESGGNAAATSPVGAQGLMQLMPGTARELGVENPYDPRQNMEGGVKYLRRMLDMFGGDLTKAVAAYNAGPGNVQRFGGVPPFGETQSYVKRVLG